LAKAPRAQYEEQRDPHQPPVGDFFLANSRRRRPLALAIAPPSLGVDADITRLGTSAFPPTPLPPTLALHYPLARARADQRNLNDEQSRQAISAKTNDNFLLLI
jgi:hypothetical protein